LAGLAYYDPNVTKLELDQWFGNGTSIDQDDVVQEFRRIKSTSSAVSFKLITFPNKEPDTRSFAFILIRGTTNSWDMLTDAQLWSAAALMQQLRALLPLGFLWTPGKCYNLLRDERDLGNLSHDINFLFHFSVIDYLIVAINKIESESVNKVSFYKDTGTRYNDFVLELIILVFNFPFLGAFAKFLLNQTGTGVDDLYSGVAVTGHSLGGGLSIITGAQNGIPAVALSGPNAMLSRKSFDPPIRREELDRKTFVSKFLGCCFYSLTIRTLNESFFTKTEYHS
jgi:lipase ATG15